MGGGLGHSSGGYRMKYDYSTNTLHASDGKPIKQFSCPLDKNWDYLSRTENDLVRYCGSCSKNVADITSFNESQMIAICQVNPEQCMYLDFGKAVGAIEQYGSRDFRSRACPSEDGDLPVVATARGVTAINDAVRAGYLVDIRETDVQGAIYWDNRWVRDENGTVRHADQYTELGDFHSVHPQGYLESPLSAYMVPPDLRPDTEVYLADVIEHVVGKSHHSQYRLGSGKGIWDGARITVHEPEIEYLIG